MADEKDDAVEGCSHGDVMTIGPDLGGLRPYLRHNEDHTLESGVMRPVREGENIPQDAFILHQHGDRNEFSVEPVFGGKGRSKGPAKANSAAFRQNWSNIFGAKNRPGSA
jgi:hypothetical protein